MLDEKQIINEVTAAQSSAQAASSWVIRSDARAAITGNHFLLFLKPEVLDVKGGIDIQGVLTILSSALKEFRVQVHSARILNGKYLEDHSLMDKHYGVINTISRRGRDALSPNAEQALVDKFGEFLDLGAVVLGGHQFLAKYPAFSPFSLSILSDNLGGTKLGGGAYAANVRAGDQRIILLNGFHPYQLEYFCRQGSVLALFECSSQTSWKSLRRNLAGATNPAQATEGSLRNRLLNQQSSLRIKDVSSGYNGVHLSAGPLEALVEIQRFLSEYTPGPTLRIEDLAFAIELRQSGVTPDRVSTLSRNPTLQRNGSKVTAFDLTEELDHREAADALAGSNDVP